MRVTLLLALALAAAGCRTRPLDTPIAGDGSFSPSDLGAGDLAGGPIDLSTPPPVDLATLGCGALAQCLLSTCSDQMCLDQCMKRSNGKARKLWNKAVACGEGFCLGQTGDPPRCVISPDGMMLLDAPNVPAGDCARCQQNVFTPFVGQPCSPPGDSACATAACRTPFELCMNN